MCIFFKWTSRKTNDTQINKTFPFVFLYLQFHGANDAYEAMLKYLNIVFTALFSMECVLKIIAFGPLVSIITDTLNNIL